MSGRSWFITGATSGIGRAMTRLLLERGERVAAAARKLDRLDDLAEAHGELLWRTQIDLTDAASIRRAADEAIAACGAIDVVVNCAGYGMFGAAEELGEEDIERHLAANLVGAIRLVRAFLPHMRERRTGRIIQLSSEAGQTALPGLTLYHAAKWGIEGFCEALATETAPFNVHVTLVEPGRVATAFDLNVVTVEPQLDEYRKGPVGRHLRLAQMGRLPMIGDPVKVAEAIIATVDQKEPPVRLVLGSDSWRNVQRALSRRLTALEAQKDLAGSTDGE